jgi:hypothetical protein
MPDYGARCACGRELVAPYRTEFIDEREIRHEIRHVWFCADCRCVFATSVRLEDAPLTHAEIIEHFLPSLLVA